MVFGSKKRPKGFMGGSYLDWEGIVGVYVAENPEQACQQAAADSATFGTFFAIEGYAWGLEFVQTPARQLGRREPLEDRLHAALDRAEKTQQQIESLTGRPQLNR